MQSTQGETFYVRATENGSNCPKNVTCEILSVYLSRQDVYFKSHAVFIFLHGTHLLPETPLIIKDLLNVTFKGLGGVVNEPDETVSQSTSLLDCTEGTGGIVFDGCEGVYINKIVINNCSTYYESRSMVRMNSSLTIHNSATAELFGIAILNSTSNGLVISNVMIIHISHSCFAGNGLQNNESTGILVMYLDQLTVLETWHLHLLHTYVSSSSSDGLIVVLQQQRYTVDIQIHSSKLIENFFRNIVFASFSSCRYNLTMNNILCSGSKSGMGFELSQRFQCPYKPFINITNSIFSNNSQLGFGFYWYGNQQGTLILSSTTFLRNVGKHNSAFVIQQFSNPNLEKVESLNVRMLNITTKSNMVGSNGDGATAVISGVYNVWMSDCTFSDNNGTGLVISNSLVTFSDEICFKNNLGRNGGGMSILKSGILYLSPSAHLSFIDNQALKYGGAIRVYQQGFRVTNSDLIYHNEEECFYQLQEPVVKSRNGLAEYFYFQNNSANVAGDVLYGGITDGCISYAATMSYISTDLPMMIEPNFFNNISSFVNQSREHGIIVSSSYSVCFCYNGTPNCSESVRTLSSIPGDTITFMVTAVDNKEQITTGFITITYKNQNIPDQVLHSSLNECTLVRQPVTWTLNFTEITITLSKETQFYDSNRIKVIVILRSCYSGYELSNVTGQCECSDEIRSVAKCISSTGTVERFGKIWIGFDEEFNCTVVETDCPYGFCNSTKTNVTLTNSSTEQCALNREGRLCGSCLQGTSLVFGSNNCQPCHGHLYSLVIIPFALAGISLVCLLWFFNLTVSVGTINGLLLFFNIVKVYQHLLSETTIPFLSQLTAWINLDLGIETCFIKEMDSCQKIWFQFAFPFYLWIIALMFCIFTQFCQKEMNSKPLSVLSTIILLSYSKLLHNVSIVFTPLNLKCTNGSTHMLWRFNPTIRFMEDCHLSLFIFAVVVTACFLLPYTLFILLIPLLEHFNGRHKVSFLKKLQPFIDTYGNPHKRPFRNWTGFYLLTRVLALVFIDSPNVSEWVLIIISLIYIMCLSAGVVYQTKVYLLDVFFLLSILVMIYIIQGHSTSDCNVSCKDNLWYGYIILMTTSLLLFLFILFYHLFKYSAIGKLSRARRRRHPYTRYKMRSVVPLFNGNDSPQSSPLQLPTEVTSCNKEDQTFFSSHNNEVKN